MVNIQLMRAGRHCDDAPSGDLGDQGRLVWDAAVEALTDHYTDFDLNHVEPAGVLRCVVELDAVENAACFLGWEPLESTWGVSREIVEDGAYPLPTCFNGAAVLRRRRSHQLDF